MDHFQSIYATYASAYHRMIAAEDAEGGLLPAILSIAPCDGGQNRAFRILDLGTGTGRFPLLLRDCPARVVGLDLQRAMLQENQEQRRLVQGDWDLVQGDMRRLPIRDGWADLVIAGWAIGHLRSWFEADWQAQVEAVLLEMQRALRPGGALIILETLTTGSLSPSPPTPELAEYYAWLEEKHGFSLQTIQTDYQFSSVDEALLRTGFFFDPELAALIRQNRWARVPEWTGLWSKLIPLPHVS